MKRNFKLLVAVLVLAVMVFTFASCDVIDGVVDKFMPHEHEYSADWSSDETNHWHAAICDDGAEPADLAAHTIVEGVCSVCGYEMPEEEKPACTHSNIEAQETKAATCTEEGELTYTCSDCGYSYTEATSKINHTSETIKAVEPTCTETGLSRGEKCSVCDAVLKAQTEIPATGHDFADGLCKSCYAMDPNYAEAVTYYLGVQGMDPFAPGAKADKDTETFVNFFTIHYSAGMKLDSSKKTFDDGFSATQRLNWQGSTDITYTVTEKDGEGNDVLGEDGKPIVLDIYVRNAIEFVVPEGYTASVTVWWVCGGDGRQLVIYNAEESVVDETTGETIKNELHISTLEIGADGKYYLGNTGGSNYFFEVAVTLTPVSAKPSTPTLNGSGTDSDPYVLPTLGDYTCAYPGGYDLVWYQVTAPSNGYVTVSSSWNGAAWLKVGTSVYATDSNSGSGAPVNTFALAGETVYIGVADWDEQANEIPFTVSFEEVNLGSVEAFVGSWKLEVEDWSGITTYIFNINEDGTGTAVEKGGWATYNYTLSTIVVEGVAIVTLVDDDNNSYAFNFTYNSETDSYTAVNNMMGISGDLLPYNGETDEPKPEVSYDTVVVIGANTLYFSADEIDADTATRKLNITVAGNYKFASGNLFVASVVDANGNAVAKNEDYSYTLAEGEYTLSFAMLSMFGASADSACSLNVEEVVPGGDIGGGEGDDGDETYTEPFDSLKDSLDGEYKFDNYNVYMMYNGFEAAYYANVYAYAEDGSYLYDLYFTYEATANDDGSYTLTLTYASRPDYEYGTDYVDTVLGYEIVIGGETSEPEACEHEFEENIFYHPEMVSATCTTPGVAVFECIYCDYYYTQETPIDPAAHGWNTEETVITAATCTENGVMSVTCLDCNATWQEDIYASHDLEETTVFATCTTDGSYYAKCKNCDYEESNVIPANGHYNYLPCGQTGACVECGEEFTKGHDVDPCEGGMCFNCWETIAPSHTWVNATCTAPKTCSVCETTEGEALGHDYDNIPHDATCTAGGYVEHICALCDHTYNDGETEALGHKDENGDFKCDNCSTTMLPASGETLTIPQALAIAKLAGSSYTIQKYYITGIVTNLYNTQYGNFYIKDADGNQICIYGLYSYDGSIRYDAMSYKPVEGDEVTVYTVLGMYDTTYQGKNAWLDDVVAHEHNYSATVTAPTCLASGYTTHTCSVCSSSYTDTEVAALGHTTENGTCERCNQVIGSDAPVIGTLAEFTFGANGSATHKDPSSKFSNGKSYTVNGYSLTFTSATNCYDGGNDAKGNSCMKMGTSSAVGSFTVTVADNVTEVVIYVAQYKSNATKVSVNGGTAQTISTASNNGEYTAIVIDTTVNKTFTFATVSGGVRCMIDTIVFNGYAN